LLRRPDIDLVGLGDKASFDELRTMIADGTTAVLVIFAMAFGLIVPKMCIEFLYPDPIKSGSSGRR